MNSWTDDSISQSTNQPINHSFIHSINQSVNQSVNQSINQSMKWMNWMSWINWMNELIENVNFCQNLSFFCLKNSINQSKIINHQSINHDWLIDFLCVKIDRFGGFYIIKLCQKIKFLSEKWQKNFIFGQKCQFFTN